MRQTKAIYARGNIMISRFKICSNDVKSCLFQSYLRSPYGSQLWTDYPSNVFRKACVAYNNICRTFFNIKRGSSMSEFYVNNDMDSFLVLYRKCIGNFRNRLLQCDNLLVQTIVSSVFFHFNSSHATTWKKHLFNLND